MSETTENVVLESVPEEEFGVTRGWSITDLSGLEWALERLGTLRAEAAENDAMAREAIERVRARTGALNATLARAAEYFEHAIATYAEAHRDELLKGGKKKSRAFPGGTVGWRSHGGGLRVLDEDAVLSWALQQPASLGLTRTKVELAKKPLQEYFASTGEVPPGCDHEPKVDQLYVTPAESELHLSGVTAGALSLPK